jgi:hypothetical protein
MLVPTATRTPRTQARPPGAGLEVNESQADFERPVHFALDRRTNNAQAADKTTAVDGTNLV